MLRVLKTIFILIIVPIHLFAGQNHPTLQRVEQKKDGFTSMEEFAKQWTPPLSPQELSILEPEIPSGFDRVRFKKDGTIRGLFCQEQIVINTKPADPIIKISMFSGERPLPICSYKGFRVAGQFFFNKSDFSLNTLVITPRNAGSSELINGMHIHWTTLYFTNEAEVRNVLKGSIFNNKRFFMTDPNLPSNTVTTSIMLGEKMSLLGTEFLSGTEVVIHLADLGVQDEFTIKDPSKRFEIQNILQPTGHEVLFQDYVCKEITIHEKQMVKCKLAKSTKIGPLVLPEDEYILIDPRERDKSGEATVMVPQWRQKSSDEPKPIFIKDGKIQYEGALKKIDKFCDWSGCNR